MEKQAKTCSLREIVFKLSRFCIKGENYNQKFSSVAIAVEFLSYKYETSIGSARQIEVGSSPSFYRDRHSPSEAESPRIGLPQGWSSRN